MKFRNTNHESSVLDRRNRMDVGDTQTRFQVGKFGWNTSPGGKDLVSPRSWEDSPRCQSLELLQPTALPLTKTRNPAL